MNTERDAHNKEQPNKIKKKGHTQPEPINKQDPREPVEVEQQTSSSEEKEKPAGVQ